MVGDLADARLLWRSETNDLGFGKGSVSGYLRHLAENDVHPGSWSAPIIADGKVFVTSFQPSGEHWASNAPQLRGDARTRWMRENPDQLKANLRIEADDTLTCIDATTGRTIWRAVEPGKGLNLYMGKREGFGVSAAYSGGRVFSMGTTGRLYAYDADSGEKLWETDIGPAHERMEAERKRAIDERRLAKKFGWDASLIVADGVLIAPMFDHGVDMGLRGVRATDGKVLWELTGVCSRYATPALTANGRGLFVLVANRQGELRLIAPQLGKVLWTVNGLQPIYYSLAPSDNTVLLNVGSKKATSKGKPKGLLAAYRFDDQGAKRVWTMPDREQFWFENHMDSCARRRILLHDGLVYFHAHHKGADGAKHRYLNILQEDDGAVLHTTDALDGGSLMYLVEDRLLYVVDGSHSDRLTMKLFAAERPTELRQLGAAWKPPQRTTTGYEVYMEIPVVDGRMYLRTQTGRVHCYDLNRAPINRLSTKPLTRRPLRGHTDWVTGIAFSPDGKRVYTASDDDTLRIWDAASGRMLKTIQTDSAGVTSLAISRSGKRLVTGHWDSTVAVWDAATGKQLRKLEGHKENVTSAAFDAKEDQIASGGGDDRFIVWNARDGSVVEELELDDEYDVTAVAFHPRSDILATGDGENIVRLWFVETMDELWTLSGHQGAISDLAFSPNGKRLASASWDNTVRIWDPANAKTLRTLAGHKRDVTAVAYSADGDYILTASEDRTAKIWTAGTGELLNTLSHEESVTAIAISRDGKRIATGSKGVVYFWESDAQR